MRPRTDILFHDDGTFAAREREDAARRNARVNFGAEKREAEAKASQLRAWGTSTGTVRVRVVKGSPEDLELRAALDAELAAAERTGITNPAVMRPLVDATVEGIGNNLDAIASGKVDVARHTPERRASTGDYIDRDDPRALGAHLEAIAKGTKLVLPLPVRDDER